MAIKTKPHPVVGPFQRKVAMVIKEMKSQSVADAQMTAIDLQHEIGFLLRLHQWAENSWQHRQLSELIDELDHALQRHSAPPADVAQKVDAAENLEMLKGVLQFVSATLFSVVAIGIPFGSYYWLHMNEPEEETVTEPRCKYSSDGTASLCYGGLP